MIHNEREYKISKSSIVRLESALNADEDKKVPDWVNKAQKNALMSQIQEIREDVKEYEDLKSNKDFIWECPDLRDLPEYLIKARIASGLSQKELAEILSLKPQQIQRYESELYKGANLNRLIDIATAVGVSVSGYIESVHRSVDGVPRSVVEEAFDLESYPVKEMVSRGWVSSLDKVKSYISNNAGAYITPAMHRKKIHGKNSPNLYSLIAWQARVLQKAKREINRESVKDFKLDDSWINNFVQLSNEESSPLLARDYLASKGVILIVERHLEKTYLDGAAMMADSGNPVIALTLRHDRLDNFWFVLMHELGHVFRHLFHGHSYDFFDEEDGGNNDPLEREADEFALENLIPNDLWDLCVSQYSMNEKAVLADSQRLGISPAIIAGRIRKQSGNYYSLTELVGSGTVRELFKESYND